MADAATEVGRTSATRKPWRLWLVLPLVISCSECSAKDPGYSPNRWDPGYRFIIPENFKGCAEIELGVDGGRRFPRRDGFAVVEIDRKSQRFTTAEPEEPESDRTVDEVWIRSTDGSVRRSAESPEDVWSGETVEGGPWTNVVCFGGAKPPQLVEPVE